MELKAGYKKTEFGVIPEDWEFKCIGELSNCYSGGTPNTSIREYYNGNISWISSSELNKRRINQTDEYISQKGVDNSSAKMVASGTLLLAMYGATAGVAAITNISGAINQAVLAIIPSTLSAEYLYQFFKLNKDKIINTYTQGGQPNLSGSIVKSIQVSIPKSKSEQTAIATALSDADAFISSLEKLIDKKRKIKQGVMQRLLKPGEGWKRKTLKEVAKYRRGSFPQPYGLDKWYDNISGYPFVQVFDVDDNFKLKADTKSKISKEAQPMSVFIPNGSVIITLQGSIGRIAITQYDAYVDRTLLIFESFLEPFDKYFFVLTIYNLFDIEKQKAPGGIIKTITKEALSKFVISFPEIDEQSRIARIIQDLNEEILLIEHRLSKTKSIKQGMMQNLLTGKIRLVKKEELKAV